MKQAYSFDKVLSRDYIKFSLVSKAFQIEGFMADELEFHFLMNSNDIH